MEISRVQADLLENKITPSISVSVIINEETDQKWKVCVRGDTINIQVNFHDVSGSACCGKFQRRKIVEFGKKKNRESKRFGGLERVLCYLRITLR